MIFCIVLRREEKVKFYFSRRRELAYWYAMFPNGPMILREVETPWPYVCTVNENLKLH